MKKEEKLKEEIERLNSLNPHDWSNEFETWEGYCDSIEIAEAELKGLKEGKRGIVNKLKRYLEPSYLDEGTIIIQKFIKNFLEEIK